MFDLRMSEVIYGVFCEEPHPEAAPEGEKDFVVDPLYTFSVGGRNYS